MWHMVQFICMQSHITKSECLSVTGEGLSKGRCRTYMSRRSTEAHSSACKILKGPHMNVRTQQSCLISAPALPYITWDEIRFTLSDGFFMNESSFDIFTFGWLQPRLFKHICSCLIFAFTITTLICYYSNLKQQQQTQLENVYFKDVSDALYCCAFRKNTRNDMLWHMQRMTTLGKDLVTRSRTLTEQTGQF